MIRLVLNEDHLADVMGQVLSDCRHRLFVATADVKDLHVPLAGGAGGRGYEAVSLLELLGRLGESGVEIHLLHSGTPSGPVRDRLKRGAIPGLTMRRCPRVHAKVIVADGRWMYLGSANLTGAGLGAKSPRRRNFEAGICTDELDLIDPVLDMLQGVWEGDECGDCGRKDHCPVPLEEPDL